MIQETIKFLVLFPSISSNQILYESYVFFFFEKPTGKTEIQLRSANQFCDVSGGQEACAHQGLNAKGIGISKKSVRDTAAATC